MIRYNNLSITLYFLIKTSKKKSSKWEILMGFILKNLVEISFFIRVLKMGNHYPQNRKDYPQNGKERVLILGKYILTIRMKTPHNVVWQVISMISNYQVKYSLITKQSFLFFFSAKILVLTR